MPEQGQVTVARDPEPRHRLRQRVGHERVALVWREHDPAGGALPVDGDAVDRRQCAVLREPVRRGAALKLVRSVGSPASPAFDRIACPPRRYWNPNGFMSVAGFALAGPGVPSFASLEVDRLRAAQRDHQCPEVPRGEPDLRGDASGAAETERPDRAGDRAEVAVVPEAEARDVAAQRVDHVEQVALGVEADRQVAPGGLAVDEREPTVPAHPERADRVVTGVDREQHAGCSS